MLVTDLRCWWHNHYVGDISRYTITEYFQCIKSVTNISNLSPTHFVSNFVLWHRMIFFKSDQKKTEPWPLVSFNICFHIFLLLWNLAGSPELNFWFFISGTMVSACRSDIIPGFEKTWWFFLKNGLKIISNPLWPALILSVYNKSHIKAFKRLCEKLICTWTSLLRDYKEK